jgi:hypothetical protein
MHSNAALLTILTLSTRASSQLPSIFTAVTQTLTVAPTPTFPPVGSIPKDYSPAGLEKLWSMVYAFFSFHSDLAVIMFL